MVNLYNNEIGNSAAPTKCARKNIPGTTSSAAGSRRRYSIAMAIGALAVVGAAAFFFASRNAFRNLTGSGGPISEKSIAVLPFQNLSDDKSNAYFTDGIQDEILTRLAKIGAIKVISRSSTQKYKSVPDNLREVGKQLGVAHVLEGSVQKVANAVHVNVQLIRAATDEHLWAESYNRTLDDVFGVEGEVATPLPTSSMPSLRARSKRPSRRSPHKMRRRMMPTYARSQSTTPRPSKRQSGLRTFMPRRSGLILNLRWHGPVWLFRAATSISMALIWRRTALPR